MTLEKLEEEILALPDEERMRLIDRLSQNTFGDSEKEALLREKSWDKDPSLGMSLDELKKSVSRG